MHRALLLLLCAGCGRVSFDALADAGLDARADARPCTPVGHDEDADGVDDACDVCPHIVDAAQPDLDGDGVGDACDPVPGSPNEHIVLFDAFTSIDPAWSPGVFDGDSVTIDAPTYNSISRALVPSNDVFEFGGAVLSETGGGQVTVSFNAPGPPEYYCEIIGSETNARLAFTSTDDAIAYNVVTQVAMDGFVAKPFVLRASHRAPDVSCHADWDGPHDIVGAIPASNPPIDELAVEVQTSVVRLDYFIQIHSD